MKTTELEAAVVKAEEKDAKGEDETEKEEGKSKGDGEGRNMETGMETET